jgi:hypothetical protein
MATKLMVTVSDPEVPLLLYVATSDHAVSGVLIHEKYGGAKIIQRPVYFVSEAISGVKLNYAEIEKITYAVLTSSRKHKNYFEGHEITVPIALPLGDILTNKEASRE